MKRGAAEAARAQCGRVGVRAGGCARVRGEGGAAHRRATVKRACVTRSSFVFFLGVGLQNKKVESDSNLEWRLHGL